MAVFRISTAAYRSERHTSISALDITGVAALIGVFVSPAEFAGVAVAAVRAADGAGGHAPRAARDIPCVARLTADEGGQGVDGRGAGLVEFFVL